MEAGLESVDVGIDESPPVGDRRRQPLVPVLDEIGVVDLEQGDRHVHDRGLRGAGADLVAEASMARPEAAVEIGDPPDGTDDTGD